MELLRSEPRLYGPPRNRSELRAVTMAWYMILRFSDAIRVLFSVLLPADKRTRADPEWFALRLVS